MVPPKAIATRSLNGEPGQGADVLLAKMLADRGNAKLISKVIDALRGHGMTYLELLERARRLDPTLTESEWEDMMEAADHADTMS